MIVESWLFAPPLALAGLASLKPFKPVLVNSHGSLTLNSVYAKDSHETNRGLNDTSGRLGFRQSLNLTTLGYVYNPNLVLLDLSGTIGKDQSRIYDSNGGDYGLVAKRREDFDGYDLNALFLRQKPYTLQLFTSRDTKFATSATDFSSDNEETVESGGEFTYNKRGYKTKLKYAKTQRIQTSTSNDTDYYDLIFDIYKPSWGSLEDFMTSVSTRYQEVVYTNASGGEGGGEKTQDSALSNHFGYKMFDFSTDITSLVSDFTDTPVGDITPAYAYDLLSVNENIGIDLPWDFSSRLLLAKNTGNDESTSAGFGNELFKRSESTRDDERYSFTLTQNLYDSLVTTLLVNKESMLSNRSEWVTQRSGITSAMAPVDGQNETNRFDLGARYRKLLPSNSLATAFLSTRSNDTQRTGLTQDLRGPFLLSTKIEGGGTNAISLDTNTDTTNLTVEVFRRNPRDPANPQQPNPDNSDGCNNAYQYPRAEYPQCWIGLERDVHFTIERVKGQPQVTVDLFSLAGADLANLGFDYGSYESEGPFPFRVKSILTPADSSTTTNSAGAGLTLFELISAEYQHSVTTQEGNYAGYTLDPKVVDDLFAMGLRLTPFTFRASREWIRATGDEIITELKLSYDKSIEVWEMMTVSLSAEAHTAREEATDAQGVSQPSSEDGYSYHLDARTPLPYINASLRALSNYTFTRGEISRLMMNAEGAVIPNQSLGIGDRSVFQNSISLNKPFKLPWVDCSVNTYLRYLWETTTANDDTTSRDTWQYGINALRVWRLGATTINLRANYAITEESAEVSRNIRWFGTGTTREERTNNTSVILTIVRQLF